MIVQEWAELVSGSLQSLWYGFVSFLPNLLGAVLVFIIGWIVAALLGRLVGQMIRILRVDQILERMGMKKAAAKANLELDSGKFVGELVRWFFIIVFLMAATEILRLSQVTDFLKQVLLYIPQLIVAVLILLAATLIANFLQRVVRASVEAAGLGSANFLAMVTRWSILVFAALAALLQLGIASALIQTLFTGIIAALVLAIGLAFGLGGRDTAAQVLEKIRRSIAEK